MGYLVWMLSRALFGVLFKDFELFQRVPRAMQQACIFYNSWRITWMACIVSLAFTSANLLGVRWRGGCSSLLVCSNTGTVGFFPLSIFGKWPLFCIKTLWFSCTRTCCMYPCRTFLKNTIPVGKFVLPMIWGQSEGIFCSILQGPFCWRRLTQGKGKGGYSVPSVVRPISWTGYFDVFALHVS